MSWSNSLHVHLGRREKARNTTSLKLMPRQRLFVYLGSITISVNCKEASDSDYTRSKSRQLRDHDWIYRLWSSYETPGFHTVHVHLSVSWNCQESGREKDLRSLNKTCANCTRLFWMESTIHKVCADIPIVFKSSIVHCSRAELTTLIIYCTNIAASVQSFTNELLEKLSNPSYQTTSSKAYARPPS